MSFLETLEQMPDKHAINPEDLQYLPIAIGLVVILIILGAIAGSFSGKK